MFIYCYNNPINYGDESGYWPSWMTKGKQWLSSKISSGISKLKSGYNYVKSKAKTIFKSFANKVVKTLANTLIGKNIAKRISTRKKFVSYPMYSGKSKVPIQGVGGYTLKHATVKVAAKKALPQIATIACTAIDVYKDVSVDNYGAAAVDIGVSVAGVIAGVGISACVGALGLPGIAATGAIFVGTWAAGLLINSEGEYIKNTWFPN